MLDAIRKLLGQAGAGPSTTDGPGGATGIGAPPGAADTAGRSGATIVPAPLTGPPDEVAVAACTLLLEIAHADSEFAAEERRHIESAMARHFNLAPAAVTELMAAAESERRSSVDHFQYTRQIAANFNLGQKTLLAEIMWGVILADGRIASHEEYLVRKMANLLDLEPGYLSQARRAAGEK
ncbi:MAG: TerB family tellurite resistance protein [Candidatus Eisenbacteria bacterium]|mgnify:CR=1 FL=1|nr:TerB family tellurite resistance protein [Candidatus Eisenbacteria bacterium]